MRQASPAMIALLNSGENFIMSDLYTFTLQGGTVLRYSNAPTPLFCNGLYFPIGPKFERSKINVVVGTQVDEFVVQVYPDTTDLVGVTKMLQALWQGVFDGALLQVERAFMPTYGDTSPGTVVLFAGRVSEIDCSRTGATISCKSHLELLNIQMPRRLWQTSCTHAFGDAQCQFDRSSLALTFAATAGSTTLQINGAPMSTTPFKLGTIIGVSGANAGASRTISNFTSGGYVTFKLAFLSPVAIGDQFQILPGCDRTLTTCTNVFNNSGLFNDNMPPGHFGGFPYIPNPETSV